MKHYDYEINLFIDEELPEENQKELFSHLADCEKCQSTFREFLLLKEKSKIYFADNLNRIKNKSKTTNLFYKIGFYASAAAAILLLFLITTAKPKETFITKNEVRVDTIFVPKEISIAQTKITRSGSLTPGKEELIPSSQQEYLRYVMSLRTVKFTEADKLEYGSIQ